MKFSLQQLQELEIIDKLREKIMVMMRELEIE